MARALPFGKKLEFFAKDKPLVGTVRAWVGVESANVPMKGKLVKGRRHRSTRTPGGAQALARGQQDLVRGRRCQRQQGIDRIPQVVHRSPRILS